MGRLWFHQKDARSLGNARVCCIGPQTKVEANRWGVIADLVPKEFQAEGILEALGGLGYTRPTNIDPTCKSGSRDSS